MTISDETYLKKLREPQLNFQRVAFEQRLRRGEKVIKRKHFTKSDDGSDLEDNYGGVTKKKREQDHLQHDEKATISFSKENSSLSGVTTEKQYIKAVPESSVVTRIESEPTIVDGSKFQPDGDNQNVIGKEIDVNTESNPVKSGDDTKTHLLKCKKKIVRFENKPSTSKNTGSSLKFNRFTRFEKHKICGVVANSLTSSTNSLSCSYEVLGEGEPMIPYVSNTSKVVKGKTFEYSNQGSSKRQKISDKLDFFKDTKLHASRTSLMMRRSLANEKLVPTSAMNTHDTLVMNPMQITFHLKASPFRNFFNRYKHKLTPEEEKVWKRFRECSDSIDDTACGLSAEEYTDILKDELKLTEVLIVEHIKVIEKVKTAGVTGLKIKHFEVCSHSLNYLNPMSSCGFLLIIFLFIIL